MFNANKIIFVWIFFIKVNNLFVHIVKQIVVKLIIVQFMIQTLNVLNVSKIISYIKIQIQFSVLVIYIMLIIVLNILKI